MIKESKKGLQTCQFVSILLTLYCTMLSFFIRQEKKETPYTS